MVMINVMRGGDTSDLASRHYQKVGQTIISLITNRSDINKDKE